MMTVYEFSAGRRRGGFVPSLFFAIMVAHCGLDIISLYNETFQTGKIDWDCTILKSMLIKDYPTLVRVTL
jgi:hypothetical protein